MKGGPFRVTLVVEPAICTRRVHTGAETNGHSVRPTILGRRLLPSESRLELVRKEMDSHTISTDGERTLSGNEKTQFDRTDLNRAKKGHGR
jgi:hypothetical protein